MKKHLSLQLNRCHLSFSLVSPKQEHPCITHSLFLPLSLLLVITCSLLYPFRCQSVSSYARCVVVIIIDDRHLTNKRREEEIKSNVSRGLKHNMLRSNHGLHTCNRKVAAREERILDWQGKLSPSLLLGRPPFPFLPQETLMQQSTCSS